MPDPAASAAAPADNKNFYLSPLYKLLYETFPHLRTSQGLFDVPAFAAELNISGELIYRWLRSGKIKPVYAQKIIDLAPDKLTREIFIPFVFA